MARALVWLVLRPMTLAALLTPAAIGAQPAPDVPHVAGSSWGSVPGLVQLHILLRPEALGEDGAALVLVRAAGSGLPSEQACATGQALGEIPRAAMAAAPDTFPPVTLSLDAPPAVFRSDPWALCVRTSDGGRRPVPGVTFGSEHPIGRDHPDLVDLPSGQLSGDVLRAGATVLSWDPARRTLVRERVRSVGERDAPIAQVLLSDGTLLNAPSDMSLWVEGAGATRPVSALRAGDQLRSRDGHEVRVVSVDTTRHYYSSNDRRLAVTGSGTYFRHGLLVSDGPGRGPIGEPFVEPASAASVVFQENGGNCDIALGIYPREALPVGVTAVDFVVAAHAGAVGVERPMTCSQGRVLGTLPRALWDTMVPTSWHASGLRPAVNVTLSGAAERCLRRGLRSDFDVLLCGRTADRRRVALSRFGTYGEMVPACLAEGTAVTTVDGPAPIESLRVGQRLVGWDQSAGRAVEVRVGRLVARGRRPVAAITLEDGTVLRATAEHPFWVASEGRWHNAAELVVGTELARADGSRARVRSVGAFDEEAPVFDLSVTAPHDYFANGVLVHNY